jgi:hypothetical protein
MFAGMRQRLTEDPSFFVVITELALPAKRHPIIREIGEHRDDFWSRRVTGIGGAQGVFRTNLDVDATALGFMTQIKGMSHHAAMRERHPSGIDAIVATVAAQVDHWLTCHKSLSPTRKKIAPKRVRETRVESCTVTGPALSSFCWENSAARTRAGRPYSRDRFTRSNRGDLPPLRVTGQLQQGQLRRLRVVENRRIRRTDGSFPTRRRPAAHA